MASVEEELRQRINELEKELDERQQAIDDHIWDKSKLQAQFENEKARLREEIEILKSTDSMKELSEVKAQLASTRQDLTKAETTKAALIKDLTHRCQRVMELESELDESKDTCLVLEKRIEGYGSESMLHGRVFQLERELHALSESYKRQFGELSNLRSELQAAERKIALRDDKVRQLEAAVAAEQSRSRLGAQTRLNERTKHLMATNQHQAPPPPSAPAPGDECGEDPSPHPPTQPSSSGGGTSGSSIRVRDRHFI